MADQPKPKVKRWVYPFLAKDGKEIDDPQVFLDALSNAQDGSYPIGDNGLWHGGVHFDAGTGSKLAQDKGVRCIADGEVVAYRIDDNYPQIEYPDNKKALYSTGFVLVRHRLELPPLPQTPAQAAAPTPAPPATPVPASPAPAEQPALTFFSLYMHVLNWKAYQTNETLSHPEFWTKSSGRFRVGKKANDRQQGGLEPSGSGWAARFPTSQLTSDLTATFQVAVNKFINAIKQAGGSVSIAATYRPPERAYLMHYSWCIANEGLSPVGIPSKQGVNIDWAHLDANGISDNAAAVKGAKDMVDAYDIQYEPSLTSRHTERQAIDMRITGIIGMSMNDGSSNPVIIDSSATLNTVGASYGVHKLVSDPPHWSTDGH